MANLASVIDDIVAGNDYTLTRTITAVPAGAVLAKAWLTVKRRRSDADADAIAALEITSTVSASGQITDTGADTSGAVVFYLSDTQTGAMLSGRWYAFDLKVLTDGGALYTPESGRMRARGAVTRDAS